MTETSLDQATVQEPSLETRKPRGARPLRSRARVLVVATASLLVLAASYMFLASSNRSDAGASSAREAATALGSSPSQSSSTAVEISLIGSTVASNDVSVLVDDATATITSSGTYAVSGVLDGGHLIIDAGDDSEVRLILQGATIISQSGPAVMVASAGRVTLELAAGTSNRLSYWEEGAHSTETSALFSVSDLKVVGTGSLTVESNRGDGIVSEAGLTIATGSIRVGAEGNGLRATDFVVLGAPDLVIDAAEDGIRSGTAEPQRSISGTDLGYVSIAGGTYQINAGADGIAAETDVLIYAGDFEINSNQGSTRFEVSGTPTGISAEGTVAITGGTFATAGKDN